MINICMLCQQPFNSLRSDHKYCSRECFLKRPMKKMEVKCKQCGKLFFTYPSINSIYCSRKCAHQSPEVLQKLSLAHQHKEPFTCKGCGKVIMLPRWVCKKRKYCSQSCAKEHTVLTPEGREKIILTNKANKGVRRSDEFKEKLRKILAGNNKGRIHTLEHRKKNSDGVKRFYREHPGITDGPNSSNWKGGISKLPYPWYFNRTLCKKIKGRDGHKCQLCGATDRLLHTHHINYIKENCDPYNLITLCNSCNTRANFDRPSWTIYFQNWMSKNHPEYFPNRELMSA